MNLEQTLEALDWAAKLAAYTDRKDFVENCQSLRDALPSLIADAETLREMKARGPVAYVIKDLKYPAHEEVISKAQFHPDGDYARYLPISLYALPDTKESGS